MKTNNPKTINEHLDLKYGKAGAANVTDFEQNADFFLKAELVKKKRKETYQ